jgi:hypothetical protein
VKLSSNGRALLGAGAALAAVLALLFWRALFQDRVLTPADTIFTTAFFADVAPAGFSRPTNPLLFDQVYQFAPWRLFARVSLLAGHLPLWNPHSLAGTPFIATTQSAVFYPINLLLLAVPFERTFVWSAILRLWTAGMLTFLLARRVGLPPLPGLIAALAFMLSGFLIVGIGHPHTGVAIWLPGIALAAELALAAHTRAAVLRAVALLALLVGVQFTAGHVETSLDILFGSTVYLLIRWRQLVWPRAGAVGARLGPLLVFGAGWALGAGLAAMQLLPFLEWLPLSEEAGNRAAGASFVLFDPGTLKNLLLLPLFVFPNVYNNPTWDLPYFDFLPWGRNYNADVLYVGVLPFLLAIVALLRCWRTAPVVRAWGILGLVALGRALYLPVFGWLDHLPLLDLGKPHMLRLVGSFSVCMLAGFGTQALFADGKGSEARTAGLWRDLCAGVLVAGVALMLIGKVVLPSRREQLIAVDRWLAEDFHRSIGGEPRPAEAFDRDARRMAQNTIMAFRLRNVAMYAPAAIAAGALLVGWAARRRTWSPGLRGAVLVLAASDLVGYAWPYNPTVSRRDFYPAPPILAALARDTTLFRFSATRRDLTADAHMMFGLSDIRGLDFPTRWYATYAGLAPEHVPWRKITFDGFDSPLLRVLNVKYVFAEQQRVPLSPDRVERVIPAGRGRLWQVRNPQPRSFMVYQARDVRTDAEAAGLLRREPEAVFSRVLLSADQGELPGGAVDSADGLGTAEVSAIEYGPLRSAWRVRTDRGGYLFTGDAYYPGWKAELDGQPATLYRANLAFRAVRVPAGEHVVVHRFEPRSVRVGLAVAAVSLLAVASLLIAAWAGSRERRARSAPEQQ